MSHADILIEGQPHDLKTANSVKIVTVKPRIDTSLLLAMTVGLCGGIHPLFETTYRRRKQPYSPCKDCGNMSKGGHCFKCQQKAINGE